MTASLFYRWGNRLSWDLPEFAPLLVKPRSRPGPRSSKAVWPCPSGEQTQGHQLDVSRRQNLASCEWVLSSQAMMIQDWSKLPVTGSVQGEGKGPTGRILWERWAPRTYPEWPKCLGLNWGPLMPQPMDGWASLTGGRGPGERSPEFRHGFLLDPYSMQAGPCLSTQPLGHMAYICDLVEYNKEWTGKLNWTGKLPWYAIYQKGLRQKS